MARVLVVDDAAVMRKMVSDALTKGGHEVVGEAGNGTEAIARFQELKPEVTTLDTLNTASAALDMSPGESGVQNPRGKAGVVRALARR
jgi:chemotaxis response regulator CheB